MGLFLFKSMSRIVNLFAYHLFIKEAKQTYYIISKDKMQHNETRITMPSSTIRNVVQVPGKIMYFTSSLQILCAIITAITKVCILVLQV